MNNGAVTAVEDWPAKARYAERRSLTVLFSDLVGSTALSERLDPEELGELIRAYRKASGDVIERYDGHVAQYQGDGLIAYFGWPVAHEDDAERSVRAALEIVQAVKAVKADPSLEARVGVATGTVVVGAESQSDDAFGEAPNLAARLQALAGPGEVVIANDTRRLVGTTFDLVDLGPQSLKGITAPVQAWRVLRVGDATSRFEAGRGEQLTPLVGRAKEIGLLLDRQARARESHGQVVLLSGEPGIGKSRVLRELRRGVESQGVRTLRFQCSPYHENSALWPSIDNFERVLRYARDEASESKLEKLEALIVDVYGEPSDDVRLFASLLSIPCEGRYGSLTMTPQRQKEETLRALVRFAAATARSQSCVVLFEDVHWADPTTLEVLELLVDQVKNLPLLVVLTHRPGEFQNPWAGQDHVTTIELTRLTRTQSRKMVSRLAGDKALPDNLVEQILTKTDGVPLFVEELTKSIVESGQLKKAYNHIGSSDSIVIPRTLSALLLARLDRYMPDKRIAQIGAAIGREFSYELISAVTSQPNAYLDDMLECLAASGLAFRTGAPPQATYSFKHALVQDAAYDSLLNRERPQLHTDIARTIEEHFPDIRDTEPEVLARHYTRAGSFERDAERAADLCKRGATYWIKAGQNALGRMALTEAIAHLDAGLQVIKLLPKSSERDRFELECRVLLSTAWEAYRGWPAPQLAEVLKPALPLARATRQPKLLARTLWGLWVQLMSVGPVAKSLVWAEELLKAGEETEDEELLLVGHMAVMVTNFWLGNPLAVKKHAEAIIERYERDRHVHIVKSMNHDPKTLVGIYLPQVLWMLGYPDKAAAIVDERDAHARLVGHPFDSGFVLTLGAWVFHYRREPEKQYARNEELQELARDAGLPFISEVLAPYLGTGISLAQQGRLSEGIEDMQRGIQYWEAAGAKTVTPYIRSRLGEAIALGGDVETGLSHINAMLEQIQRPGWKERSHIAEILRLKGWMLSTKGDFVGAERCYRASLRWAKRQKAKSWELRTATSLARLWQAQGKRKEAYDLLAPVYDWFTEGFDTKDLIEARELLQELSA